MPDSYSISRRRFLEFCAAGSGYLLLAACQQTPAPLPTADSIVNVTIIATPTETLMPTLTRTAVATATAAATPIQPATLTPRPTLTPLTPTLTPTNAAIYLPSVSHAETTPYPVFVPTQQPAIVNTPVSPPPPTSTAVPAPQPTSTPVIVPLPTNTPTLVPTPTPTPRPCLTPVGAPPELAPPYVGLHASADPVISDAERCTFLDLRPSLIKIMTFHPPEDIAPLVGSQPDARWIVRAFLEFGGRAVTSDQFVEWTLGDMVRTVNLLPNRDIVIELHNEPNLVAEGWQRAWSDGASFANWWLEVLAKYRAALPGARYIYPGLSPGGDVGGIRRDHFAFLEASRAAVEAADGLGVHLYWAGDYPMSSALAVLDETIRRFPNKLIWITEASYNAGGIDDAERARQYLAFVDALRARPTVQGVTFFVASASDPAFSAETWVGKGIAKSVGNR